MVYKFQDSQKYSEKPSWKKTKQNRKLHLRKKVETVNAALKKPEAGE